MAVTPGAVRIRALARTDGFPYALGNDALLEVQGANGEWSRLRGFCGGTVRVYADEIVTATLEMELAEAHLDTLNDAVIDRRPRWRRLLNRIWK